MGVTATAASLAITSYLASNHRDRSWGRVGPDRSSSRSPRPWSSQDAESATQPVTTRRAMPVPASIRGLKAAPTAPATGLARVADPLPPRHEAS